MAAAMAVDRVRTAGLREWLGGALGAAQIGCDAAALEDVARRGVEELGAFLAAAGVL